MKKILILILILLIGCDNDSEKKKKTILELGEEAYAAGSYQEALENFESYILDKPDENFIRARIGLNWSKLKLVKSNPDYLNEAKAGFYEVISRSQTNEDARFGYANILFAMNTEIESAVYLINIVLEDNKYQHTLEKEMDTKYVHLLLAELHYFKGNYSASLSSLNLVYSELGESNNLTAQDSDFKFKLSETINAMLLRFSSF